MNKNVWFKIGKIFDLDKMFDQNEMIFAQSPQAVVFDDYVRFYFSTRSKDSNGKFLSHIAYVDMTKDFNEIIKISSNEIIPLGELGCFDEHGIFPLNVLREGDKIHGFSCGWNRRSAVSVDTSIGYAVSCDGGETFEKYGNGPILTSSINEPFLVGDPFVTKVDSLYYMWYIYGTKWKKFDGEEEPQRIYKIAQATSENCIDWIRDGKLIIDDIIEDESQALPTVVKIKDKYHMVFCYRHSSDFRKNPDRGYRLGHAVSVDLVNWIRDDEFVEINSDPWDSEMKCYPHLFEMDNEVYLAYNGNEFGKTGFGVAKYVGDYDRV